MTEDEFWSATDQLRIIHGWARARYAAPWAVLGAVLLRVAATTEPHVQLPGLIGGRASLNLMCAFVSASGGGKGISDKVARLVWPADINERPIGSGEGIAETFRPPAKEGADDERITRAIINVPEIDTLAGLADKQGSILLATIKSVAMGELIGQANASKATTRIVPAHSYRCCIGLGVQYGHGAVIFNDTTGGTPQRVLWFPTTDPTMPSEAPDDPPPLNTRVPMWAPNTDGVVEIIYGPDEIRQTVIEAHLSRQRGEAEALDGHALLTRCKVAAALAIMQHRSTVSALDWKLSEVVMQVSNRTRDGLIEHARRATRAKVRERAMSRVYGEEVVDDRRAEVVRRRIMKILSEGPASHGTVHSRIGKREYKELFPGVIASLLQSREVLSEDTQRGKRYSLSDGVNPDPGVKIDNSRSDALTPGVKVEPTGTVTDIDSRRSHEPHTKLPVRQWLQQHIAELHSRGAQQINSRPVFAAGEAEGYGLQALRDARYALGIDIVAKLPDGSSEWWIDPTTPAPRKQTIAEWADNYLRSLTDGAVVDIDDVKARGEAAGHSWESLRRIIVSRSDIAADDRGRGGTTWTIVRPDGEVSA